MSTTTNLQRAAWAETAILAFTRMSGTEREESLVDLLTDLMHWARFSNFDFDAALDLARMHYGIEA